MPRCADCGWPEGVEFPPASAYFWWDTDRDVYVCALDYRQACLRRQKRQRQKAKEATSDE